MARRRFFSISSIKKILVFKAGSDTLGSLGQVAKAEDAPEFCARNLNLVEQISKMKSASKAKLFIIIGTGKGFSFSAVGHTIEEVTATLNDSLGKTQMSARTDEVFYSVNGAAPQRLYNRASYWNKATDFEPDLMAALIEGGLKSQKTTDYLAKLDHVADGKTYKIEGTMQGQTFILGANFLDDVTQPCVEVVHVLRFRENRRDQIYD